MVLLVWQPPARIFKNSILWVGSVAKKTIQSQHCWLTTLRRISPQNLGFSYAGAWRGHLSPPLVPRQAARWVAWGGICWNQQPRVTQHLQALSALMRVCRVVTRRPELPGVGSHAASSCTPPSHVQHTSNAPHTSASTWDSWTDGVNTP